MSKYKKIINSLILISLLTLPGLVLAQSKDTVKSLLDKAAGSEGAGFDTSIPATLGLAQVVGSVVRVFISLLGIIFICYTIYGGYLWMTAAGSEEKISKAKVTIRDGIIGLIVVLSSAAIYIFIRSALVSSSGAFPGAS